MACQACGSILHGIYLNAPMTLAHINDNRHRDREIVIMTDASSDVFTPNPPSSVVDMLDVLYGGVGSYESIVTDPLRYMPVFEMVSNGDAVDRRHLMTWEAALNIGIGGLKYLIDGGKHGTAQQITGSLRSFDGSTSAKGDIDTGAVSVVGEEGQFSVSLGINGAVLGDYSSILGGGRHSTDVDWPWIFTSVVTLSGITGDGFYLGQTVNTVSPYKFGVIIAIDGNEYTIRYDYAATQMVGGETVYGGNTSATIDSATELPYNNYIDANRSTIIGGDLNSISGISHSSTILNGAKNVIANSELGLVGGTRNKITGNYDTLTTEPYNHANGSHHSTILNGDSNSIDARGFNLIASGTGNTIVGPVLASNYDFGDRVLTGYPPLDYEEGYNSILGGQSNIISEAFSSSILGNDNNIVTKTIMSSIIASSISLVSNGDNSIVIGGSHNRITASPRDNWGGLSAYNIILGGTTNSITGSTDVTNGGRFFSTRSTILGGVENGILGSQYSSVISSNSCTLMDGIESGIITSYNSVITSIGDAYNVFQLFTSTDVTIGSTTQIAVPSASGFSIGQYVVFKSSASLLPSGIELNTQYEILNKVGNILTINATTTDTGYEFATFTITNISIPSVRYGSFGSYIDRVTGFVVTGNTASITLLRDHNIPIGATAYFLCDIFKANQINSAPWWRYNGYYEVTITGTRTFTAIVEAPFGLSGSAPIEFVDSSNYQLTPNLPSNVANTAHNLILNSLDAAIQRSRNCSIISSANNGEYSIGTENLILSSTDSSIFNSPRSVINGVIGGVIINSRNSTVKSGDARDITNSFLLSHDTTILGGASNQLYGGKLERCGLLVSTNCYIYGDGPIDNNMVASNACGIIGSGSLGRNNIIAATSSYITDSDGGYTGTTSAGASDSTILGGGYCTIDGSMRGGILNSDNCHVTKRSLSGTITGSINSTITNGSHRVNILGSNNSTITRAVDSVMVGGYHNSIDGNSGALTYCGMFNAMEATISGDSYSSVIIGGHTSLIDGTTHSAFRSALIAGYNNRISCDDSVIIGGASHIIRVNGGSSYRNIICGGSTHITENIADAAIIGGVNGRINNTVGPSDGSVLVGGSGNQITGGNYSVIVGGASHLIGLTSTSHQCGVFAGNSSTIGDGVYNSVIIGGSSNIVTLNSDKAGIFSSSVSSISRSNESVVIGGGNNNIAYTFQSTIVGAGGSYIYGNLSTSNYLHQDNSIFGGSDCSISSSQHANLFGGKSNYINNAYVFECGINNAPTESLGDWIVTLNIDNTNITDLWNPSVVSTSATNERNAITLVYVYHDSDNNVPRYQVIVEREQCMLAVPTPSQVVLSTANAFFATYTYNATDRFLIIPTIIDQSDNGYDGLYSINSTVVGGEYNTIIGNDSSLVVGSSSSVIESRNEVMRRNNIIVGSEFGFMSESSSSGLVSAEYGKISNAPLRHTNTYYTVGQYVRSPSGDFHECTVAGKTSLTVSVTWSTAVGDTTVDGSVTWTVRSGAVADVDNSVIIGGVRNSIGDSISSSIIAGNYNTLEYNRVMFNDDAYAPHPNDTASGSSLVTKLVSLADGYNIALDEDDYVGGSIVLGGYSNRMAGTSFSNVMGAGMFNQLVGNSAASSIVTGHRNIMENGQRSFIGAGSWNKITPHTYSFTTQTPTFSRTRILRLATSGSAFTLGETLTGSVSTYTAVLKSAIAGSTYRFIVELTSAIQDFIEGETLTGSTSLETVVFTDYQPMHGINNAILAGSNNEIGTFTSASTIVAGMANRIDFSADTSFIGAGAQNNIINDNLQIEVLYTGDGGDGVSSFIGAGKGNKIHIRSSEQLSGGAGNKTQYNSIVGGINNIINAATSAFIAGGTSNSIISQNISTVGERRPENSSIGGGYSNTILGRQVNAVICGGYNNEISETAWSGEGNAILGGYDNTISSGSHGIIMGRLNNITAGSTGNSIIGSNGASITGTTLQSIIVGSYGASVTGGIYNGIFNSYLGLISSTGGYNTIIGGSGLYTQITSTGGGNFISALVSSGNPVTVIGGSVVNSSIIGYSNTIEGTSSDSHIHGQNGYINNADNCIILGGDSTGTVNTIAGSTNAAILGGVGNSITGLASAFIIGSNITASRASTTHVERLFIVSGEIDFGSDGTHAIKFPIVDGAVGEVLKVTTAGAGNSGVTVLSWGADNIA